MVSVNLIFHIVSAITFVVLIWYLLHVQSQMVFMRQLLRSLANPGRTVKVDWPEAFLKRFASVQGIAFQSNGVKVPPQKIDLRIWTELHTQLEIERIDWAAPVCRLQVRQESELKSWGERLEASLQGKITVEWSSSKASSKDV
ncbi:MAG: hypothetical protein H7249_05910 [Chitinophagaceae bacterium]|nr:hypothetical protein [Oligoflexus sp.]